jgi:hypothetical protein
VSAAEVISVIHRVEGVVAVDLNQLYMLIDVVKPPADPHSDGFLEQVLVVRPARFDPAAEGSIARAELLLIDDIFLGEMSPETRL